MGISCVWLRWNQVWYDIILSLDSSKKIIEGGGGPFERCTALIVDLDTYEFKILNKDKIAPEEYFTNSYVEEILESENISTSNKWWHTILDSEYKKSSLNKSVK